MNGRLSNLFGFALAVGLALPASAGRSIEAARANAAPVIDGKLGEECWQKTKPFTDFLTMGSTNLAPFQTLGRVLYDDDHLYLGIKCFEPDVKRIRSAKRDHEGAIFRDDAVEIMIDPGATKTDYIQLAVNASGTGFDCSRSNAGASEDDSWDGDWDAATHIGDDHWSCEVRVPFCTLGVTANTPLTWGLNVCRDKQDPSSLSSIAERGAYNEATKFAQLTGLRVDLSRYVIRLGEPRLAPEVRDGRLWARLAVPVANESNKQQRVVLQRLGGASGAAATLGAPSVMLKAQERRVVGLETLAVDAESGKPDGSYAVVARPATGKVQVKHAGTKETIAARNVAVAERIRIMQLRRLTIRADQAVPALEMEIDPSSETLPKARYQVAIQDGRGKKIHESEGVASGPVTRIPLAGAKLPSGELLATVTLHAKGGAEVAEASLTFFNVKSRHKKLNALVSELLNTRLELAKGKTTECTFENPRNGWVFFSTTLRNGGGVAAALTSEAGEPTIITHGKTSKETREAMRLLPAGEHKLALSAPGRASVSLVIRAIPHLGFCKFGYHPRVAPYGPYDWAYIHKHIAPHVNCIVGAGSDEQNAVIEQWRKQGKHWLIECGVPGLVNAPKDALTAEAAFEYWRSHTAFTNPLIDGGLADEFLMGTPKERYEAWTEAVRRLHEKGIFRGKTFYPYCTGTMPTVEHCKRFLETVIETGGKIAWERYQLEQATEEDARRFLDAQLKHALLTWEQEIPGCRKHMIVVLGYLCTITAETQSIFPSVDFKHYLDMQCHLIANDPAFEGLYGLQTYTSGYVDDETLRWIFRLFRHYFIEGKTEMLSKQYGYTYALSHLRNPDFTDGTNGWEVTPAEGGSVDTKTQPGYARMQGRMGTGIGDQFLWLKKNGKQPNVIAQKAIDLVPGKLYSLKLVTGNYDELKAGKSTRVRHPITVTIDGVTIIPDKTFVHIQPNLYCYFIPPFSAENSFWFNHHHYVFRANAETAMVTIKDWASETDPGGPAGQELMLNFVELQPYFGE